MFDTTRDTTEPAVSACQLEVRAGPVVSLDKQEAVSVSVVDYSTRQLT